MKGVPARSEMFWWWRNVQLGGNGDNLRFNADSQFQYWVFSFQLRENSHDETMWQLQNKWEYCKLSNVW